MKRLFIAGFALGLTIAPAWADSTHDCQGNSCNGGGGTTNVTQNNEQNVGVWTHQNQTQSQSSSNTNNNTATGGAGGAGGAGGNGGSASSSSSATGGNATATGGNSSSSSNSGGNSFVVNDNQKLQAPAVSSFIAASGPCTGVSGGGAVSVAGFGLGMSFASLEEDCKRRELLRIGFASGNQQIEAMAAQGWTQMFNEQFASGKSTTQTSSTGQSVTTTQTADAAPACNQNLPKVQIMMCEAKGQ